MKTLLQSFCFFSLLLGGVIRALAQGTLPTVSLEVGQAEFTEYLQGEQDAAWCFIKRTGSTEAALTVHLRYTGTATPWTDYGPAPATLTLPAGQSQARLLLIGKSDALTEGDETVIVQVINAPRDPTTGTGPAYLVDTAHASGKLTLHDRPASLPPLVLIEATHAFVSETGKTADGTPAVAQFRVSRSGSTEHELLVFLQAGGHATAGVDYQKLPGMVRIPAGQRSTTLNVVPIDDVLSEGTEEVLLQIIQPPTAGAAISYVTDYASDHADVYILDDEPYIVIESPEDGAHFAPGAPVPIRVLTVSSNNFVAHVDFFADDAKIGKSTLNFFANPAPGTPIRHEFTWTNPPVGTHRLSASTTRADGTTIAAMGPVTVIVGEAGKPSLTITTPKDGDRVQAGATTRVVAVGVGRVGGITDVELLLDGQQVAESHLTFIRPPGADEPVTHEFTITIPVGEHKLVARDLTDPTLTTPPIRIVGVAEAAIVTITSNKSPAYESGGLDARTGSFTVARSGGDLSQPVTVFYMLGGTATLGTDYLIPDAFPTDGQPVPPGSTLHFVQIPAGQLTAGITFLAQNDALTEGTESVVATLIRTPVDTTLPDYAIGEPHEAKAEIRDRTAPDFVMLNTPTNGAVFAGGATIHLEATAEIPNAGIVGLAFFANGIAIGQVSYCCDTCFCVEPTPGLPFTGGIDWKDVKPGEYTLVVKALTFLNALPESEPVKITVQGPAPTPHLTITTHRSPASERGELANRTGSFTVTRSGGDQSRPLTVFYTLGGTATPGLDYQLVEILAGGPRSPQSPDPTTTLHSLQIAAGSATAEIGFLAVPDKLTEGTETVVATLIQSPLDGPFSFYELGEPHEAKAEIRDSAEPAFVVINSPTNGAVFTTGATVRFEATAVHPALGIGGLLFFVNGIEIGHALYCCEACFCAEPTPGLPFTGSIDLKDLKPGEYTLEAKAFTFANAYLEGEPVKITVKGLPPTPHLTITQPTNGTTLRADQNTKVVAVGVGRLGGITDVELLLDGKKFAESHISFDRAPGADEPVTHEFNVKLPAGEHELAARDLSDSKVISPAVHVLVTDPNPVATLTWVKPEDGARFAPGVPIDLEVETFDPRGLIFHADFYADGKRIGGADYSCPLCKPAPGAILSIPFQWTGAPVGKHLLSAVGTNSAGLAVATKRIAIEVSTPPGPPIAATRKLPTAFEPGAMFTVSISVVPGEGVQDYVIEEHPPFLFRGGAFPPPNQPVWNIRAVSDGGSWDVSTGTVKFGPFFDHQPRTLTYEIMPNGASIQVAEFAGVAVADGLEVRIGGDRLLLGSTRHPADRTPADDRISATELTAYGAAWKAGKEWTDGPNPIPMDYVTRAGALWREGESYRFDPAAGPAPLCWVSNPFLPPITPGTSGATESSVAAKPAFHGLALRRIEGQAGQSLAVTVRVLPAPGVNSSALEEQVAGTPSAVSDGGTFVAATKTIRWGPFMDGQPHTVTYRLEGDSARRPEHGAASFDGASAAVLPVGPAAGTGPRLVNVGATDDGAIQIVVEEDTMTAETAYELEVSTDLQHWSKAGAFVNGSTASFARDEVPAVTGPRFYRAVRAN